jgi:MoaA/NifB/PqqE/SkfB family radical SAM enzyme
VVPCCFSFGDDIVYGNIKELSLYEIWSVYNDEVVKLREEHRAGNYRNICARCYMRSPMLLHWAIFRDSIRRFV